MEKKAALTILARFRDAIEAQHVTVDKLILYGSYAVGANREGSDIDVVVISKDFTGKDYWERTDILSQAIYEVFEPIEAVALTPVEWDKGESTIVDYGTLFTAEGAEWRMKSRSFTAEDAELRGGEEAMKSGTVLFACLCDPLRPLR